MDDVQKITSQLEYLFLNKIIDGLDRGTMSIPQVKELARNFLQIEPFLSYEDAKTKILAFSRQREEFGALDEYLAAYYDQQQKSALIEKMRSHLKKGDIDQAIDVVKTK